jgi:alpha-mannosidase
MKLVNTGFLLLWIVSLSASGIKPGTAVREYSVLWEIGKSDGDNSDFYLAPDNYGQYDWPGFHVVGVTDPAENWPYILPGQLDTWAGPSPQWFEIIFYLKEITSGEDSRLILDFLDTHSSMPPLLVVEVNNLKFEHQTEPGENDWLMAAEGGSGKEQLAIFSVPAHALRLGENRIRISAREGSWAIWDAVRFEAPDGFMIGNPAGFTEIRSVKQKQLLMRGENSLMKPLEVEILHTEGAMNGFLVATGASPAEVELVPGVQRTEIWIPETGNRQEVEVKLISGGNLRALASVVVEPVRKWEVHLIHQTHLDIGFTHTQEEVLRMQTGYLYQALDLIDQTRDYPEEARFRWHPEGMWAIDEFLRTASSEDSARFIRALKDQSIHLDAFYVHLLSGLATGEELIELMRPAKSFEKKYDIPVRTALGSDVPGYTWGMVPAMSLQGIKFFNMAPNNNHKLGYLYYWADKPFYWQGPDGSSRVFTWMASHAYIYFWVYGDKMDRVPRFLGYLERSGFPYDIAMLRYEVGGDNGHPDPTLPEKVRAWNEKYAYPRIILSTNSRLYDSFTGRYKDIIPVFSGDLTPYWEDGAASTAADLALNREAGERLIQAGALNAILQPGTLDPGDMESAWNKIIMYDEHTWGAYCSKSDPFAPFTISQEKYKQQFALEADEKSFKLSGEILRKVEDQGSGCVTVFNTQSWPRSELVLLSPSQSQAGDRVLDEQGNGMASQRLASGELAFLAEQVPGFGSLKYRIVKGQPEVAGGVTVSQKGLTGDLLSVEIDPETGSIRSVRFPDADHELVDTTQYFLNEYLFVEGRKTGHGMKGVSGPVSIMVEDPGPLVGTLRIESMAPGCRSLVRKIRMVWGQEALEITNTVDKQKNLEPEGVYFAFPLQIPGGEAHIDIPWGVIRPETDQLPGANRNYFAVQRWMDISNDRFGITWISRDAPMMKFAPLTLVGKGRGETAFMAEFDRKGVRSWWKDSIHPGQLFFSWVMNNHWEVNYKAFQEGPVTFRYLLVPHNGSYDGAAAEKLGRAFCQPFVVVETDPSFHADGLPFVLSGDRLVVTSLSALSEGKDYLVRLYNPGACRGETEISEKDGNSVKIWYCDPSGNPMEPAEDRIELPGYGVTTLRIETGPAREENNLQLSNN